MAPATMPLNTALLSAADSSARSKSSRSYGSQAAHWVIGVCELWPVNNPESP
jgi:hypothetical protein